LTFGQPGEGDTIVAIATPPGRGAISLLRLSGPLSREIAARQLACNPSDIPNRRPQLLRFRSSSGEIIDQVLLLFFAAPSSYTGEDILEISCHGGVYVSQAILQDCLDQGARLAEPGEFTMRAFLKGKMDLAQAEAVRDLVESRTRFQAQVALQQLEGELSRRLQPLKEALIDVISQMETSLEFVEDEVEPESREQLLAKLRKVDEELRRLEESFETGKLLQQGIRVAIAGKPNTGKSSLFNSLLMDDRAIVTAVPGTTRDMLTEEVEWKGMLVRLHDTAGIREASDLVENLGVERSRRVLREADFVLLVLDRSNPLTEEDREIWDLVKNRDHFLILNKSDLPPALSVPHEMVDKALEIIELSALTGANVERIQTALVETLGAVSLEKEQGVLTNWRHYECIRETRNQLLRGIQGYECGMSEEFPLYDLRKALSTLGRITGETTIDEILGQIFSSFCIGK